MGDMDDRPTLRERMAGAQDLQVERLGTPGPNQSGPHQVADAAALITSAGSARGDAFVEDRPSASCLNAHQGKKRGRDASKASKKKRSKPPPLVVDPIPLPPDASVDTPGAVYHNEDYSATLFAQVGCPRFNFPAPDSLGLEKSYSAVALRGVQLIAQINRLTLDYEAETQGAYKEVDVQMKKASDYKVRAAAAEKRVLELEAAAKTHYESRAELEGKLKELESGQADLVRRLGEAQQLQTTTVAAFQGRMADARRRVVELNGTPRDRMLDLTEVKGNLLVIAQIQGKIEGKPPLDLDAEVVNLTEQRESLAGSFGRFVGLVEDIQKILDFSPSAESVDASGGQDTEAVASDPEAAESSDSDSTAEDGEEQEANPAALS